MISDRFHLDDEARRVVTDAAGSWAEPVPLDAHGGLPPFPADALPEPLRAWVIAAAEATQTPLDLPAMCALGMTAAVVQRRASVEVRRGWSEPLSLYTFAGLRSASRKSSVMGKATAPIVEIERERAQAMRQQIREVEALRAAAEMRLSEAQRSLARARERSKRDAAEAEVLEAVGAIDGLRVPVAPRWICEDVTPEALVGLLEVHGRIALMSAEGDGFITSLGRYSDKANLGPLLAGHAGDPIHVDRVGRPSTTIDSAALTLCLAVQPDVLSSLAPHAGRGLPARLLYALPDDLLGRRRDDTEPVPMHVEARYRALVRALVDLDDERDEHGNIVPTVLMLTERAHAAITALHDEIEPRLTGDLANLSPWAGKLRGALVRIAGLCHIVEHVGAGSDWRARIDERCMHRALSLRGYLIEHAIAAHAQMGGPPAHRHARRILGALKRHGASHVASREILRITGMSEAERDEGLSVLIERGFVREAPIPDEPRAGRKAGPRYEIHPSAIGVTTAIPAPSEVA